MSRRSLRKTKTSGVVLGPGELAKLRATQKRSAGGMVDAVPPSQEAIRAAISEQKCPFCGAGPFKMLPVHTNKVHGVDKWSLRDLAGLTTSGKLCDQETLAKMSSKAGRRSSAEMAEMSALGRHKRTAAARRWTVGGRAPGTDRRTSIRVQRPHGKSGGKSQMVRRDGSGASRSGVHRTRARRLPGPNGAARHSRKAARTSARPKDRLLRGGQLWQTTRRTGALPHALEQMGPRSEEGAPPNSMPAVSRSDGC